MLHSRAGASGGPHDVDTEVGCLSEAQVRRHQRGVEVLGEHDVERVVHGEVVPPRGRDQRAGVSLRLVVREIAGTPIDPSDLPDVPELVQRTVFIEQVELPPLP